MVVEGDRTLGERTDRTREGIKAVCLGDAVDLGPVHDGEPSDIDVLIALDPIDRVGAVALAGDDQIVDPAIPHDRQALDIVLDADPVDAGDLGRGGRARRIEVKAPDTDVFLADIKGVSVVVDDTALQLAA